MEKVFDIHAHYTFVLSMEDTVRLFAEEFVMTGTEKINFMSLPHHSDGTTVTFDPTQNVKGLVLKCCFAPNAYAFAGLEHPLHETDKKTYAQNLYEQAVRYHAVGYDGMKMLEGYPQMRKAMGLPLDSPVYDRYYDYLEEQGIPVIMHIANPEENWDIEKADPYAIEAGRVCDETYPTKRQLHDEVYNILRKHPSLRLVLAHFGFLSYDIAEARAFLDEYKNTMFDLTPGGEQLLNMANDWSTWFPFWQKYADRIVYGTDYYAFPYENAEQWETAVQRRPRFLRQLFETDTEHTYLGEKFKGVLLPIELRNKIYRENAQKQLGDPKPVDGAYLREQISERITDPADAAFCRKIAEKI